MTILSRHPYSFLFAGAGIILLTIILSMKYEQAAPTNPNSIAYVSGGSLPSNPTYTPQTAPTNPQTIPIQQPSTPVSQTPSQTPVLTATSSSPVLTNTDNNAGNKPVAATNPSAETSDQQLLEEVYSLIPSGTSLPATTAHAQSAEQQALHAYGNEAGLSVLTFENGNADMADVLKVWLTNRTDASAMANAQAIATDLAQAGQGLAGIPNVPQEAQAANTTLAASYSNLATKLQAVFAAGGSDSTLLAALKGYDLSADSFTNAYLALVNVFTLNSITFSSSEPGSAFQFPASSGL